MRYEGVTAAGERYDLGQPLSARFVQEEDSPADSFSGVFPSAGFPAFLHCNLYDGDGTLRFGGVVDTQVSSVGAGGVTMELAARSKAALLLDNEAKPQTYLNPSLGELFQNHGAPYGLQKFRGKTARYNWTYVIGKGVSEWEVFWDFCLYCIGIAPKVTPEGVLDVTGTAPEGTLRFSNTDGVRYTSAAHQRCPRKRLSQLWLQKNLGDGYTGNLQDLSAMRQGVQRTRYVTAANWQGRRTLKEARRQSDALVLVCPEPVSGALGMQASLSDPALGDFQNYSVAGLTYLLDGQGERWLVTLRTELG